MHNLYQTSLVMHITGLAVMGGSTLAAYVATRQCWIQYATDRPKAAAIYEAVSKFSVLFGAGIALLILSGVTMMALTGGAFGEQTWFRIKFVIILLIIANGLVIGRRQGMKLMKMLSGGADGAHDEETLTRIRRNINWFHITQLMFFLVIFTLSIFKFN
jgi:hypothetical protein